jgi:tRNA (cytidine/uridine-2'-O-)-methyltransferase
LIERPTLPVFGFVWQRDQLYTWLSRSDFRSTTRQLRRAGLDYWDEVHLQLWDSFDVLQREQSAGTRYFFLTTKTQCPYYSVNFQKNDFLVFGRETKGLPHKLLAANTDSCISIPMHGTRSLNLATAVAIVLFEAVRQQHV